jgi:SNF2 family DNA or RNA helicase
MPKIVPTEMATKLRPYQVTGVKFLRTQRRGMLCDEMGLGKSAELIGAADGDTLVVAPANVINTGTWDREIAKWAADPSQFWQCAYSNVSKRDGATPTLVLNPEIDRQWGTIILDESHYIKNAKAKRTQVIRKLAKLTDRLYLATGTPIPNWPHEIFTSLQMIWPEKARGGAEFGSYWRWVDEWFKTTPSRFNQFGVDIHGLRACNPTCANRNALDPCDHYRRFVVANFGPKFLQRLRDDVLQDLPPLTEQVIPVPFTVAQEREYQRMRKDYLATVDDEEIVAWSDGAKNTMLDRITTGLGLITSPFSIKDSGKLELLHEDLSERYRPTLVVAHYRSSVEACAKIARDLGRTVRVMHGETPTNDRPNIMEDFQSGKVDVLCGSIETVAEGLTLTAADMTILVETSWKPHRNQQVIRRIHRLGQTLPCTIRVYEAKTRKGKPTLDTHKRQVVLRKTQAQQRVLTAARFKQMLREDA